jgi:GT2 family glycosyltransferase
MLPDAGQVTPRRARGPRFSVIVPTYNRAESLGMCLSALAAQDFPRHAFEVLVVDDGSSTPPRDLIAQCPPDLQVRMIEQANAGPAAARNAGAREARGEYLAFTDDDCRPEKTWLSTLDRILEEHPRSVVGGRVINILRNPYSAASQMVIDFLYRYFSGDAADGLFFVAANVAMSADLFNEMGGFDLTFPLAAAEDRDLCDRWRERGLSLVFADGAVVFHAHLLGFRSFCRQHFTYGRGAWYLNQARRRRARAALRVPPVGFYSQLALFPFSRERWPRALALSAAMALSQAVYVAGYLRESVARDASRESSRSAR